MEPGVVVVTTLALILFPTARLRRFVWGRVRLAATDPFSSRSI